MCASCKLLANSGHAVAKLQAFEAQRQELIRRNHDLAPETYHRALEIICKFDKDMDELLALAENGPHVPFEFKIIPSAPAAAGGG